MFKKSLYILLLIKCLYWLIYYQTIFGPDSYLYLQSNNIGVIKNFAFILYNHFTPLLALIFIINLALICLLRLITAQLKILLDIAIWFLTINIHFLNYPASTGGTYLLNIFLLFNTFLLEKNTSSQTKTNEWYNFLHNISFLCLVFQVCWLYLASFIAKLNDAFWINGDAVNQISRVYFYNSNFSPSSSILSLPLTYITLTYQALFSIVVFIKPVKNYFLAIGIIMHIYIFFIMGITEFSITMIVAYLLFTDIKKIVFLRYVYTRTIKRIK